MASTVTSSTGTLEASITTAIVPNPPELLRLAREPPALRARIQPPMAEPIAEPRVLPTYCKLDAAPSRSGGANVTRYSEETLEATPESAPWTAAATINSAGLRIRKTAAASGVFRAASTSAVFALAFVDSSPNPNEASVCASVSAARNAAAKDCGLPSVSATKIGL